MSIKIDMTSSDVDKQIEVLKHFPDLAEKHYRPAIQRDTKLLQGIVAPNIPVGATGRALATFGSKVAGKGFRLKGTVGWYDRSDPYYPNVLEYGSSSHDITLKPKNSKVLAWEGGFSMGHTFTHPGFAPREFMASGYESVKPIVETDLFMANERIIADLAAI